MDVLHDVQVFHRVKASRTLPQVVNVSSILHCIIKRQHHPLLREVFGWIVLIRTFGQNVIFSKCDRFLHFSSRMFNLISHILTFYPTDDKEK